MASWTWRPDSEAWVLSGWRSGLLGSATPPVMPPSSWPDSIRPSTRPLRAHDGPTGRVAAPMGARIESGHDEGGRRATAKCDDATNMPRSGGWAGTPRVATRCARSSRPKWDSSGLPPGIHGRCMDSRVQPAPNDTPDSIRPSTPPRCGRLTMRSPAGPLPVAVLEAPGRAG